MACRRSSVRSRSAPPAFARNAVKSRRLSRRSPAGRRRTATIQYQNLRDYGLACQLTNTPTSTSSHPNAEHTTTSASQRTLKLVWRDTTKAASHTPRNTSRGEQQRRDAIGTRSPVSTLNNADQGLVRARPSVSSNPLQIKGPD